MPTNAALEAGPGLIRIIICDDHALIRRGLRETLSEEVDLRVVGEAGDYGELRQLLRGSDCDVLLLDINLPGRSGLDVLAALAEAGQSKRTLVLSTHPEEQYAIRVLKLGAMGYLSKAARPEAIVEAVRTVGAGRKYITPEIAQVLADRLSDTDDRKPHETLSDREHQTLLMIARGVKLSEMAQRLALSPKTVSVYRARVMEKMGVSSNADLTSYCLKNGLID